MVVKEPAGKNESGLTLIELLAAMVILVFGVVAVLSILVEAQKSNNLARAKTMAVNAAEEQLETIFRTDPSSVFTDFNGDTFPVQNSAGSITLIGAGAGGNAGSITVDGNEPHLVTVTVTWIGQGTLPAGTISIRAIRSIANR